MSKPIGLGNAGELSAFHPNACVRIVRPSQPPSGMASAWYAMYGTPLRPYGNDACPGPNATLELDITGWSSRTHQLLRMTT